MTEPYPHLPRSQSGRHRRHVSASSVLSSLNPFHRSTHSPFRKAATRGEYPFYASAEVGFDYTEMYGASRQLEFFSEPGGFEMVLQYGGSEQDPVVDIRPMGALSSYAFVMDLNSQAVTTPTKSRPNPVQPSTIPESSTRPNAARLSFAQRNKLSRSQIADLRKVSAGRPMVPSKSPRHAMETQPVVRSMAHPFPGCLDRPLPPLPPRSPTLRSVVHRKPIPVTDAFFTTHSEEGSIHSGPGRYARPKRASGPTSSSERGELANTAPGGITPPCVAKPIPRPRTSATVPTFHSPPSGVELITLHHAVQAMAEIEAAISRTALEMHLGDSSEAATATPFREQAEAVRPLISPIFPIRETAQSETPVNDAHLRRRKRSRRLHGSSAFDSPRRFVSSGRDFDLRKSVATSTNGPPQVVAPSATPAKVHRPVAAGIAHRSDKLSTAATYTPDRPTLAIPASPVAVLGRILAREPRNKSHELSSQAKLIQEECRLLRHMYR